MKLRSKFTLFFCAFGLLAPLFAFAQIKIINVMYDVPGSDVGREWIAIKNTGTDLVDMSGYKLFEAGVNHKLAVIRGTSTLVAGDSAVIVTNAEMYLSDNPGFLGTIFRSSFSLSNTGETIEIRDSSFKTVDSYSYSAPPPPPKSTAPKPTTKSTSGSVKNSTTMSTSSFPVAIYQSTKKPTALWLYILGLVALVGLGITGVFYTRMQASKPAETPSSADEFEIIE